MFFLGCDKNCRQDVVDQNGDVTERDPLLFYMCCMCCKLSVLHSFGKPCLEISVKKWEYKDFASKRGNIVPYYILAFTQSNSNECTSSVTFRPQKRSYKRKAYIWYHDIICTHSEFNTPCGSTPLILDWLLHVGLWPFKTVEMCWLIVLLAIAFWPHYNCFFLSMFLWSRGCCARYSFSTKVFDLSIELVHFSLQMRKFVSIFSWCQNACVTCACENHISGSLI